MNYSQGLSRLLQVTQFIDSKEKNENIIENIFNHKSRFHTDPFKRLQTPEAHRALNIFLEKMEIILKNAIFLGKTF